MKSILLTLAAGLSACATSADTSPGATPEGSVKASQASQLNGDLHTLHRDNAPYWDVVSFTGYEQALRKAYDTQTYDGGNYGVVEMDIPDIDFDEFYHLSGFGHVSGNEDTVSISFQSCNGTSTRYEIEGEALTYKGFGQTAIACERAVIDRSGKRVTLFSRMLADDWFASIAPKIKGYAVSADGQSLTLLDENQDVLAEFKYRGEL